MGIGEQTFYRWKKKCVGMGVAEVMRLPVLEEENSKLKQLVADLSLDKQMLQAVFDGLLLEYSQIGLGTWCLIRRAYSIIACSWSIWNIEPGRFALTFLIASSALNPLLTRSHIRSVLVRP